MATYGAGRRDLAPAPLDAVAAGRMIEVHHHRQRPRVRAGRRREGSVICMRRNVLVLLVSLLGLVTLAPSAAADPALAGLTISQTAFTQSKTTATFDVRVTASSKLRATASKVVVKEVFTGDGISTINYTSTISTTCRVVAPPAGKDADRWCRIAALGPGQTWELKFKVSAPHGTFITGKATVTSANYPSSSASASARVGYPTTLISPPMPAPGPILQ